jgi:hypothetical protein
MEQLETSDQAKKRGGGVCKLIPYTILPMSNVHFVEFWLAKRYLQFSGCKLTTGLQIFRHIQFSGFRCVKVGHLSMLIFVYICVF